MCALNARALHRVGISHPTRSADAIRKLATKPYIKVQIVSGGDALRTAAQAASNAVMVVEWTNVDAEAFAETVRAAPSPRALPTPSMTAIRPPLFSHVVQSRDFEALSQEFPEVSCVRVDVATNAVRAEYRRKPDVPDSVMTGDGA